jgi:hypothetical protein
MILSTFKNTCRKIRIWLKSSKNIGLRHFTLRHKYVLLWLAILKIATRALSEEGMIRGRQDSRTDTSHCYVIRKVRCLSCSNFSLRKLQKPQQNPDTHHLCKGSNQRSRVCKTLAVRPQNSLRSYSHRFPQAVVTLYWLSQDGEEIRRFGISGITICACTAHGTLQHDSGGPEQLNIPQATSGLH